jgi:serine/threonine-protein kinase
MRRFLIQTCVFSAFLLLVAESKGQTSPWPPGDWRNNYTVNQYGFVVVRPSPYARSSNCGAIAYSKSTGRYGYAWGKATRADAERVALRDCRASDAFVACHGTNTWLALASGSGESYGWGWSNESAARARETALTECSKRGAEGRIQVLLHTSSGPIRLARSSSDGNKPRGGQTDPTPVQLEEHFVPHIGIYYKKVYYQDGSFGAQLTRDAVPGSPAAQIRSAASTQRVRLERGDTIFEIDGQRFRTDEEVRNHRLETTMRLIDRRTGRTIAGSLTLP